jgi:hypothetical protein
MRIAHSRDSGRKQMREEEGSLPAAPVRCSMIAGDSEELQE